MGKERRPSAHAATLRSSGLCGVLAWCLVLCLTFSRPLLGADPRALPLVDVLSNDNPELTQQVVRLLQRELSTVASIRYRSEPGHSQDAAGTPRVLLLLGSSALIHATRDSPPVPGIVLFMEKERFLEQRLHHPMPLTALYHDAPLVRQALLGRQILPQAKSFAVLASPGNEAGMAADLAYLASLGLQGHVFVVDSPARLMNALSRALLHGEFLLATPDTLIYNRSTIKHILLTAYRQNRVLIGPSRPYVRAGALATSYTPLEDYIAEAAEMIRETLRDKAPPAPRYPRTFRIEVNQQVARSLNIVLADESSMIPPILEREAPPP